MMNATFATNGTNGQAHAHEADEAIDTLYSWWPGASPTPAPCPEALFSCTLRGHLDGIETLLTVRGMTAAAFQANLAAIRGLLDAQTPPVTSPPPAAPLCPTHGAMKPSTKGQGWYCPTRLDDGAWCPTRRKST